MQLGFTLRQPLALDHVAYSYGPTSVSRERRLDVTTVPNGATVNSRDDVARNDSSPRRG